MHARPACMLVALGLLLATTSGHAQASIFPEWVGREQAILRGEREGLVGDAETLFAQSSAAPAGDSFDGTILCHIHVDEPTTTRWDAFADPDLRVVLQAGRARLTAWGPENSRDTYLSFAAVSARARSEVSFRVFDRDVTGDERIDTLTLRGDGSWPWILRGEHTQLECRAIDPALAAARALEGEQAAEAALEALTRATPDLTARDFARPAAEAQAQSAVVRVMTYRGASDPRARALRTQVQAAITSFDRALQSALTEARRSSPGPNTWVTTARGASIQMTSLVCGERALGRANLTGDFTVCAVTLETRGDTRDLQADVVEGVVASPGVIERSDAQVIVRFATRINPSRALLRVGAPELQTIRLR